jgi:hypothetical protein
MERDGFLEEREIEQVVLFLQKACSLIVTTLPDVHGPTIQLESGAARHRGTFAMGNDCITRAPQMGRPKNRDVPDFPYPICQVTGK